MIPIAAAALFLGGVVVLGASVAALARRHRDARWGTLVAVDAGHSDDLRSVRWRLVGRPDLVRRDRHGRPVPIEVKRRNAPAHGPFRSHRVQLWAYCLLLEESGAGSPAFGVVRYADREDRVPWDAAARAELLAIRAAVSVPYDGRATPTPARCARCRWAAGCDARAS